MTNPHHSMSHPLDPHPVRPGTSAALTARTIDATIHPPLVRAQEAVAAFIPRVSAPVLDSPLLFGMLCATLIFVWVAHRAKYRPSALLLSAALVMGLTSFHPVGSAEDASIAAGDTRAAEDGSWRSIRIEQTDPAEEQAQSSDDTPSDEAPVPSEPAVPTDVVVPDAYDTPPTPADAPSPPDEMSPAPDMGGEVMPVDAHVRMITPEAMRQMVSPEMIRQMMSPEEMAVLERERAQLRVAVLQMRRQLREEARRMAKKRYY